MEVNNKERKESYTKDYDVPVEDFEHRFPLLFKRMVSFDEIDDYRVYIELDDGRTLYYDIFYHLYWKVKRFGSIDELSEDEWKLGFSQCLKDKLRKKRFTNYEFANMLGITSTTLSRYVNGKRMPDMYLFYKMVDILECNAEDLLPKDHIILK